MTFKFYIGNITHPNTVPSENKNSRIYLLDISNHTWVDTFEPKSITENNNQDKPLKIVIGIISGILATAILVIIGIFGYRWYQERKQITGNV